MIGTLLAQTPPPGVDPLVGWMLAGLCMVVLALAGVIYRQYLAAVAKNLACEKEKDELNAAWRKDVAALHDRLYAIAQRLGDALEGSP